MKNGYVSSALMAVLVCTLWACTEASATVDEASRFYLYASLTSQDVVAAYNIGATTGVLTPVGAFPTGHAPTAMALDGSGKRLYVANYKGSSISAYAINQANGDLEDIEGSPFAAGPECWDIALSPERECIYGLHYDSNLVSVHHVEAVTGALSPVNGSPFSINYWCSWALAVDPAGKFCYVTNSMGSSLSIYPIDPFSGGLSVASHDLCAVDAARGLAIDQSGKLLLVASANNVEAFRIDAATGGVAALGGSRSSASGSDVAMETSGRFAYVSNPDDDSVSAYRFDAEAGVLSVIPGAPFAAGSQPWGIVVDPTGRFVYVANLMDRTITGYRIDQRTGALSAMAGSPFAAQGQPMKLVIAEIGKP